ncbi:hypothetical protein EGYY_09360 [Eggerthella sp. YY7918]|nr:hypothetical protein EGYY_09360 [Eggerthella sp. YY7918]
MNDSGIHSQAGFVFQIHYFILRSAELSDGETIGYEAVDDVSISREQGNDESLGFLRGSNYPQSLIQVKKADIDSKCCLRIMFNWLICLKEHPFIEKFIIIQEAGRGFCEEPLKMCADEFVRIIRTQEGNRSLASRVRDLYCDDNSLKKSYNYILERYEHRQIKGLEDCIKKSLEKPFHSGGISPLLFTKRVDEFVTTLEHRILTSMQNKQPYILRYSELMALYEDVTYRISEERFEPSFPLWKSKHPIDTGDASMRNTREARQLRYCFGSEDNTRFFNHLYYLSYYADIRYILLERAKYEHIDSLEEITYSNFEAAKDELANSEIDTPAKRLAKTKEGANSFTNNEFEKWGSCIFLTREGTSKNQLISWKDEDDAGLIG